MEYHRKLLAKQYFLQLSESDRKSSFVNYLCALLWQPPFKQAYFPCAPMIALLPCTIHSRKRRRPPTVLQYYTEPTKRI